MANKVVKRKQGQSSSRVVLSRSLPATLAQVTADGIFDASRRYSHLHSNVTRKPLGESTGNVRLLPYQISPTFKPSTCLKSQQPEQLPSLAADSSTLTSFNTSVSSGQNYAGYDLTAPSTLSNNGVPIHHTYPAQTLRDRRDARRLMRVRQQYINPIYLSAKFQQYRDKQETRKEEKVQKWPEVLEKPFLDALMLMPHMGRRKFTLKGKPYGRNMLIMEYVRIASNMELENTLKYQEAAIDEAYRAYGLARTGIEDEGEWKSKLERERKQVSSHMQVLKGFFAEKRCFHFLFPAETLGTTKRRAFDDRKSFKNNPVLMALNESRLPEVKPNYKYFSELLNSDNDVVVRPKSAWLYLFSDAVLIDEKGNGVIPPDTTLDVEMFPHLKENSKSEREYDMHLGVRRPDGSRPHTLLHEYVRSMEQHTSSTTGLVSELLEDDFPQLASVFKRCIEDESLKNAENPLKHCEIIHLRCVLELPKPHAMQPQPPEGTELSSMAEVTIHNPDLRRHYWKARTWLSRPARLCGASEERFYESGDIPIAAQFTHQPGCPTEIRNKQLKHEQLEKARKQQQELQQHFKQQGLHAPCVVSSPTPDQLKNLPSRTPICTCPQTRRHPEIKIPWPAHQWASILSRASKYDDGFEAEVAADEGDSMDDGSGGNENSTLGAGKGDNSNTDTSTVRRESEVVGLLRQVCMVQELLSLQPGLGAEAANKALWTRRALFVWTFENSVRLNRKGKLAKEKPGTAWKFMTILDPLSQYHQQNVYISAEQAAAYASEASAGGIADRNSVLGGGCGLGQPGSLSSISGSGGCTHNVVPTLSSSFMSEGGNIISNVFSNIVADGYALSPSLLPNAGSLYSTSGGNMPGILASSSTTAPPYPNFHSGRASPNFNTPPLLPPAPVMLRSSTNAQQQQQQRHHPLHQQQFAYPDSSNVLDLGLATPPPTASFLTGFDDAHTSFGSMSALPNQQNIGDSFSLPTSSMQPQQKQQQDISNDLSFISHTSSSAPSTEAAAMIPIPSISSSHDPSSFLMANDSLTGALNHGLASSVFSASWPAQQQPQNWSSSLASQPAPEVIQSRGVSMPLTLDEGTSNAAAASWYHNTQTPPPKSSSSSTITTSLLPPAMQPPPIQASLYDSSYFDPVDPSSAFQGLSSSTGDALQTPSSCFFNASGAKPQPSLYDGGVNLWPLPPTSLAPSRWNEGNLQQHQLYFAQEPYQHQQGTPQLNSLRIVKDEAGITGVNNVDVNAIHTKDLLHVPSTSPAMGGVGSETEDENVAATAEPRAYHEN